MLRVIADYFIFALIVAQHKRYDVIAYVDDVSVKVQLLRCNIIHCICCAFTRHAISTYKQLGKR